MNEFEKELAKRGDLVYEYLTSARYQERFVPEVIHVPHMDARAR